jgi:thymidylate synthase ThyX
MSPTMTRSEAIQQIREAAKTIALQMMKIHPALPHLKDEETMKDSLKALHEMTVQLETIKKRIGRLEKQDDSTLL